LAEGIPALGLWDGTYYRNKFEGLFAWYDQPGWAVPVDGLDARNLADLCTRLVEQGDALRPGLVAKSQEMAQRSAREGETVLSLAVKFYACCAGLSGAVLWSWEESLGSAKASRSTSDAQDSAASGGARWREPLAFLDVQGDLRARST